MNVLFVASEVVGFAKTGGLADVAGALPQALAQQGSNVTVVMPYYKTVKDSRIAVERVAGDIVSARLGSKAKIFFIENDRFFGRDGLYQGKAGDYPDNLERFAYFCRRTLTMVCELGLDIDVIHINDWQASLIPVHLKTTFKDNAALTRVKTVLTIHNLGYQGLFPAASFSQLGFDKDIFSTDGLEFFGQLNLLKGGIVFSDIITTVSPTYAREIQTKEFGFGLDGVLVPRRRKIIGILNGLDYGIWNPQTDAFIPKQYSREAVALKPDNKKVLQKKCGFPLDGGAPVIGVVSRFAAQKGMDILVEAIEGILATGAQVVILGEGDDAYVSMFRDMAARYPRGVSVNIRFDDPFAHLIYAGSDMFLMPSQYEPCGLGQMISLKYGTIPVVFKTGGLADTVTKENGFLFEHYSAQGLLGAVRAACDAYRDSSRWKRLVDSAMQCDFSWKRAAQQYHKAYERALAS